MGTALPVKDDQREFDVIVYGATGFTGELAAEHLCSYYLTRDGKYNGARFALAGRSLRKLEDVRDRLTKRLSKPLDTVPLVVADSSDPDSLISMCERTRVVATTVGPYLLYGEPLVAACVKCRTHYCDLTGELPFIAKVFREYGQRAVEQGVKIVHTCGWISVAADLSCLLLEETSLKRAGRPCEEVKTAVTKLGGGVSGGTLASAADLMDDPSLTDPYYLCKHALPKNLSYEFPEKPTLRAAKYVEYDKDFGYTGMYLGGSVDGTVVRWTSALLGNMYGKNLTYSVVRAPEKASRLYMLFTSLVLYLSVYAFRFKAIRSLLYALHVLPRPGEGPSRDTLEKGCYKMRTVGRTHSDKREDGSTKVLRTEVALAGDGGDPGYSGAAKMMCEAALCMAKQMDECTQLCGVLSPAAAVGAVLKKRLQAKGVKIEVETVEEGA